MRSTATDISRRAALGLFGGSLLLPLAARSAAGERIYLNAYGGKDGFGIAAFDAAGRMRYELPLPSRGHGFARRTGRREAAAFSRRPGDLITIFNAYDGTIVRQIPAAEDRNFCGHGAYSADGRLLYATEVVGSTGEGVLGVYTADDDYRRVAEWPTGGLDPHEVLLMPDGRLLAIANGGILMRADMPRLKLNIPDMAPSLVYLDSRYGRIVAQIRPPSELRQLSIRHLAIDRRGHVAIAMQYEGPQDDRIPLVALHDGKKTERAALRFLVLPERERSALRQYCGSATTDCSGRYLAVTSPRGNLALVLDVEAERLVASVALRDICGVAPDESETAFVLSSGFGSIHRLPGLAGEASSISLSPRRWDNHMIFVDLAA